MRAPAAAIAPLVLGTVLALAAAPGLARGAEGVVVLRLRAAQLAGEDSCDEAITVARKGRERYPEDAALARTEGLCASRLGRYEEAVAPLETALRLDPTAADVAVQLGVAHYQLEEYDAARAAFATAAELDPDDAELLFYRGLLALRAERHAEAAALLSRASARDPDFVEPYASYYEGRAWSLAREYDKARQALARVVERAPDSDAAEQARRSLARFAVAAPPKFRWAKLRAGMEWNNNAVLRSQDVILPRDIADESDWRGVWSVELGQVLYRDAKWQIGVVGGYYGSHYIDLDDFEFHYPSIALWVTRRLDELTRVRLRPDFAYGWRDGPYLASYGVTASLDRDWPDWGQSRVYARYERQNLLFRPFDDDDGPLPEADRPNITDEQRRRLNAALRGGTLSEAELAEIQGLLGCPRPNRRCGPAGLDERRQRNRDGYRVRVGYDHEYAPWEETLLRGGLAGEYYSARGQEYSYWGVEPWLGAEQELWFEFTLKLRASYQYRRYRHRSTFPDPGVDAGRPENLPENLPPERRLIPFYQYDLDPARRREDFVRTEVEISRPINDWLTASVRWRYHDVGSNRDVFDYDRHLIGVFLKAEFTNLD